MTSILTLESCGVILGHENGELSILSPFEDTVLAEERHPFCDRIMQMFKTSRTGACELAVVTAGQVYFTTITMQLAMEEQGIEVPKRISFELDELYVDDGAQITRAEEYEPDKFIALTWWTNKIYLFKREASFLLNQTVNIKNTKVVDASFGISLQCVGFFKIPRTKTIFLLKLKDCVIMFDAESQQQYTLNFKKINSSIGSDIWIPVRAEKPIADRYAATYPNQELLSKALSPGRTPAKTPRDVNAEAPSVILGSEGNYSEDFDEASRKGGEPSQMDITEKPSAELLRESPAYHIITAETEGHGMDSPFLSNRKNLLKYNLSDELVQAMINVIEETKIKMKQDADLEA